MHVVGQKEVAQLEISVDSFLLMKVEASFDEFFHVISNLGFSQPLPPFDEVHEGLCVCGREEMHSNLFNPVALVEALVGS
jgi:hypothetical protein